MIKIEELEMKLKELSEEIEQLKAEGENGVWEPKDGERYWFISQSGGVKTTLWYDDEVGEMRYGLENVFKTEEEAEFRVEQIKVEAELRRFSIPFKSDSENYTLGYRHLFFPSKEIAHKAIDTVGEDRIKKYYFGVED